MSVSLEDLKNIADLAKLHFEEDELRGFADEFNNILNYVSMINECDTTGIEFEHNLNDYKGEILQEDVVQPSLDRDKILMNATNGRSYNGYIKTSQIVKKD